MHSHEELSDWLNGDSPEERSLDIARHLLSCAECAALVGEFEAVRRIARGERPARATADVWSGIEREIRDRAAANGPYRRSRGGAGAGPGNHTAGRGKSWRRFAAAAALSVFVGSGLGLGVGVANVAAAAVGASDALLDLRALAGVFAVLILLVPIVALAVRFSIPAVVRAFRDDPQPELIDLLERRYESMADELAGVVGEQRRLAERIEFDRRLFGGDDRQANELSSDQKESLS